MISVNKETFEKEVLQYDGKVVVEFWGNTCEPCKNLRPGINMLSEKYKEHMKFCEIDTNRAPRIAIKQRVLGLPAVRIYENGEILAETIKENVTIENVETMIKRFID